MNILQKNAIQLIEEESHQGWDDDGHCDGEDEQRHSQLIEECKAWENVSRRKAGAFQEVERS